MLQTSAMRVIVVLCALTAVQTASMYNKMDNNKFRMELVPVSSTVIPLEELTYSVGAGIHVKPGGKKPLHSKLSKHKTLQLANDKKSKEDLEKAWVLKLTKADFDRINYN